MDCFQEDYFEGQLCLRFAEVLGQYNSCICVKFNNR